METDCQSTLKAFAAQTIKFVDQLKAFLDSEKTKIQKMWQLSSKLKLLTSSVPQKYPKEVTEAVLGEITAELNFLLNEHSSKLVDCESELLILQRDHRTFKQTSICLNSPKDSEIFCGNEYQKPLSYFINIGDDLISEAKLILLNLRTAFDVLQMNDVPSFENYRKSFVVADDFLHLLNEFYAFCTIFMKYS
ncbi:uncharacterized protein LOC134834992 [Culicoides brevitarsis]|uniref:uncharacterized protein LOC134834992 n=1 Tax=Culicoides brevitarsis TaxID=469753 RepID=UPI00307B5CB3